MKTLQPLASSLLEVRSRIELDLRSYQERVLRNTYKPLQPVIVEGIEPRAPPRRGGRPACHAGVLAAGPGDRARCLGCSCLDRRFFFLQPKFLPPTAYSMAGPGVAPGRPSL